MKKSAFCTLVFCSVLAILPMLSIQAGQHQDVPKLTLSASATIEKPSDELQMRIGVVNLGQNAQEALAENSSKMHQVIDNLHRIGLTKEDYETSQFSINPTYTPYPKDPPENWKPSINGYEVTNTVLIHTPLLDMAGQIIDVANEAGANSITDIRFGIHNARDYWSEALAAAGANGVQDAQAIASATGVKLVRVLSISLNHTQVHAPQLNLAAMAKTRDRAPPIEPGDVSITANVTLIYEIK
jgi:uncharacterized protein